MKAKITVEKTSKFYCLINLSNDQCCSCGDRNLCDMGGPSRSTAVDDNDAIADEEEDDEDYDPDEEEEEQMAEGSEEDNDESDDCELITGRNKAGFDSGATACVSLLFPVIQFLVLTKCTKQNFILLKNASP